MAHPLDILLLVLNISNVFLHLLGFRLLLRLKKRKVQDIYLLNLSITEVLKNSIIFLTTIPDTISLSANISNVIDEIHIYLGIFYDYGIMFTYYSVLFYVTLDRYLGAKLNIKYPIYWDVSKAKSLLLVTWLTAAFICITLTIFSKVNDFSKEANIFVYINDTEAPFVTYSKPTIGISFTVFAITIYSIMFQKYVRSQILRKYSRAYKSSHESIFTIFRKSRFFIPVLLIASFIVFTVTPDLIFTYYQLCHNEISYTLDVACYNLFAISDLIDGIIYILLHKRVRRLLVRSICDRSLCVCR